VLTREIMGALALAILWVSTLLVAAVALKRAQELLRSRRALRPLAQGERGTGSFHARIEKGDGEGGALARYDLEQVGRAGAASNGRRTIHFSDRSFGGVVLGGEVSANEERVRVLAGEGSVWPARTALLEASACADPARFAAVFEEARKARGHTRHVRVDLCEGQSVWIGGELREVDGELVVRASERTGLLVSAVEPRAWLLRSACFAVFFAIAETLCAAAITVLVLVPPVFDGWPSKVGGALGLGFFLLVQPLGTAVRDAIRAPHRAFVRGVWLDAKSAQGEGKSAQHRVPVE